MEGKKRKQVSQRWIVVALCIVVAVAIIAVLLWKPAPDINSFQACKDAGGAIMESYPEQCAIDGQTFTNDNQSVNGDTSDYIGLSEQAALDKAAEDNKQARVVERDGEALAADASFQPGRLNLYVRDGAVYKVQIEGEE